MRRTGFRVLLLGGLLLAPPAFAEDAKAPAEAAETAQPSEPALPPPPKARSLDQLLELVKEGFREQTAEDKAREARFRSEKDQQEKLLADAQATVTRLEARSQQLESTFQENEGLLAELEATLSERLGNLGELFGVVRQVAGDTAGQVTGSLISAEFPDRRDFLEALGQSKALPSIEKLERLWYELSREMTQQGKVVRFPAPVLTIDGEEVQKEVIRAGVFTAVADDQYLLWEPEIQKLRELYRQPPSKYLATVRDFEAAKSGMAGLAIDPSRGSLLSVLVDTKTLFQRIPEGGYVGYVTIILGVVAAIFAILRYVMVTLTARKVAAQQKSDRADPSNPLGRVMQVYEQNRSHDPEALELKLDEAVMRESARVERFIWLVKVVSVVAPLLGLLGTVTGMIRTFQAITLFGAGDPKMMASGISEALVTTMIGLTVAIPLVLLHSLLSNTAKQIVEVLDEQSAGLIARQAEGGGA